MENWNLDLAQHASVLDYETRASHSGDSAAECVDFGRSDRPLHRFFSIKWPMVRLSELQKRGVFLYFDVDILAPSSFIQVLGYQRRYSVFIKYELDNKSQLRRTFRNMESASDMHLFPNLDLALAIKI